MTTSFVRDSLLYADALASERLPASFHARLAAERFLVDHEVTTKPGNEWEFRDELANRAMLFASMMPNIKGPEAGRPIELMDWQKLVFANIFGFVERRTTTLRFRQGAVFVPKGNGKTTVSAPLALHMTFGEGEGGAEGYAAAVTRDQARILFDTAKHMVSRSAEMKREWGVGALTNSIFQEETASNFVPISSDAKALDGLNVQCAVCDEIWLAPHQRGLRCAYHRDGETAPAVPPLYFDGHRQHLGHRQAALGLRAAGSAAKSGR